MSSSHTKSSSRPVVVLASGRGSNFQALLTAMQDGRCGGDIRALISDRRNAPCLQTAQEAKLPTEVVPLKKGDRQRWNAQLADRIAAHIPDDGLVVLAGFMKILGKETVSRFFTINVHPSLLPSFPGMHAAEQALAAGCKITGCTVHQVDTGVDTGPILAQAAVPILAGDDADTLQKRIQSAEHQLLPDTVHRLCSSSPHPTPATTQISTLLSRYEVGR